LLTGILAGLLILVFLLAVPVTLDFRVSWPRGPQREVVVGWGFGLVRLRIPAGTPGGSGTGAKRQAATRRRPSRGKRNMTALLRRKAARRRLTRFIVDLWRAVRKEDLQIDIRLGLADPADTGQLWAFVGPLEGMLAGNRNAMIHIEPDFTGESVRVNGSGKVSLVPLRVIGLVLALFLSPSIWRALAASRPARG